MQKSQPKETMTYVKQQLFLSRKIRETAGIVVDIDKTLLSRRLSLVFGLPLLRKLSIGQIIPTAWDIHKTYKILRNGSIPGGTSEATALHAFYRILTERIGNVTKEEIERNVTENVNRYSFTSVRMLLICATDMQGQSLPKFLSTLNGSTATAAVAKMVEATDFVSNEDIFNNGILDLPKMSIWNKTDKYRATQQMLLRHGLDIRDCTVIGDNVSDSIMLAAAKLRLASPLATGILDIPGIIQLIEPT